MRLGAENDPPGHQGDHRQHGGGEEPAPPPHQPPRHHRHRVGDAGQEEVLPALHDVFLHRQMLPLPPHTDQDSSSGEIMQDLMSLFC